MGTKNIDISNRKIKLSELLSEALASKDIILTRDDQPLARLVPIPPESSGPRIPGLHPGALTMQPDFDEPLEEDFRPGAAWNCNPRHPGSGTLLPGGDCVTTRVD